MSLEVRRAPRDDGDGDGLPFALSVACKSSLGGVIIAEASRLWVLVLGVVGSCALVGMITCERGLAPGEGLVCARACGGEGVICGRGEIDRLGV